MMDGREIAQRHVDVVESFEDLPVNTELLQHCIAIERRRNFRTLCWISSTFLLVVFAVTAILISIGLVLLKESRDARAEAENSSARTRLALDEYKRRMDGVSLETKSAGEQVASFSASLQEEKTRYGRDRELLAKDLAGFSKWQESKYLAVTGTLSSVWELKSRLAELEFADRARAERFAAIEKWYRVNKSRLDRIDTGPASGGLGSGPGAMPAAGKIANTLADSENVTGSNVEARTYQNGDRYSGGFLGGKRHGRGIYLHRTGDRYEGDFLHGKRDGQGIYRYANGDGYAGEFRDDRKHGRGTYTYADGTKVTGMWENDALLRQDTIPEAVTPTQPTGR